MTILLRKDKFHWSPEAEVAFQTLKKAMTTAPVLALPDFSQPFILETDASGRGIGAVLMQGNRPIAFLSKALSSRNQALSIYEREFLAIIVAVQKWKSYLQGHKFIIKTDQQALRHLLDQKSMNPTQQRWLTKLLGLHYEIQFKSGVENKVADALSRYPSFTSDCSAISTVSPLWVQKVVQSYNHDPVVTKILASKAVDAGAYGDFSISDGILRYRERVVVGSDPNLRASILQEVHSSSFGGHSGIQGTYMRLKNTFYWPGMKTAVIKMVKECDACQRNKPQSGAIPGLLQPLPIPQAAWTHISMDFVEGLPKSEGKNVIFIVVDRLTKYGHFLALSHPFTAELVAKLFLDTVYKLHGSPVSIVSDRDKVFNSAFWRELFRLMGTTLDFSSSYHPQTDGQTERLNQCLENYLRCMVSDCPRQWVKWLSLAEFWYNTNYHSSLKVTPFQALYGYPPPQFSLDSYFLSPNIEAADLMEQRQKLMQTLRENLLQAQNRMRFFADKKREEREFQVGEMVYLKLQPFRQNSISLRKHLKLSSRYYGPYKILERIGKVAYKLDLPDTSRVHPVFHVSLLKKCLGKNIIPVPDLPTTDADGNYIVAPLDILGSRSVFRNGGEVFQIQVQWLNASANFTTWEDFQFIKRKFPAFYPCRQGCRHGGGIVMMNEREVVGGASEKEGKLKGLGARDGIGQEIKEKLCFK